MTNEDRQNLIMIVGDTKEQLGTIILDDLRGKESMSNRHLLQALREAWSEVVPKFDQLIRAIEGTEYDGSLEEAGLSGRQLAFKMKLFYTAREDLIRDRQRLKRNWLASFLPAWLVKLFSKKIKDPVVSFLKAVNLVLGSLAHAIPLSESIKEMKEGLEQLLEHLGSSEHG
jgi:hypothetical protein